MISLLKKALAALRIALDISLHSLFSNACSNSSDKSSVTVGLDPVRLGKFVRRLTKFQCRSELDLRKLGRCMLRILRRRVDRCGCYRIGLRLDRADRMSHSVR